MSLACAILGTIEGIPRAVSLAETDLEDLYQVAAALRAAQNAVLEIALDVVAREEGYRILADHRRRALSSQQEGGSQR